MQPLAIDVSQFGAAEVNAEYIRAALDRRLPELTPALCSHDGTFVIVGSGPSLPRFLDEILEEREKGRPICAINGAHDWLCEQGIEPDFFLTVDPRPMPQNFKRLNDYTRYLIASRCNPETFDALKDRKVILFHSWSDQPECKVWMDKGKFGVGGGTTSGLRAINVGFVWGFRKFVLYGMDSCLAEDGITKRFTGEKAGQTIDVIVGGKRFLCNYAMAQQAKDFQEIYKIMDVTIDAKGDGLIAKILEERRKKGLKA
jgi:hypothetical protein